MTIVPEQCCEQCGHASLPVLVSLGLAPPCRSGVGIHTTTAFQQKALTICDDLVWRLLVIRERSRKANQKGLESLTFQQLVFTELSFCLRLSCVPKQQRKTPFLNTLLSCKMTSNNVRPTLNPGKVSGETKEVTGSWIKSRQLQQETKKRSSFSHSGGIPKFLRLWWRLSLQVMDTRCQQGTVEKPADFCLSLCWSVFQAEIEHTMYTSCGTLKCCSALVKAAPYCLQQHWSWSRGELRWARSELFLEPHQ